MSDTTKPTPKTCHRLPNVLVDVHVEAEFSNVTRYMRDGKQKAVELERACREFREFLRDHRSQDWVHLSVVEKRQDTCSNCGDKWETSSDDGGPEYCACCGAIVEPAVPTSSGMEMRP